MTKTMFHSLIINTNEVFLTSEAEKKLNTDNKFQKIERNYKFCKKNAKNGDVKILKNFSLHLKTIQ